MSRWNVSRRESYDTGGGGLKTAHDFAIENKIQKNKTNVSHALSVIFKIITKSLIINIRNKYVPVTLFLVIMGIPRVAHTACTLGPGAICIILQDEFGNFLPLGDSNTTVDIYTESINALYTPPDLVWIDVIDGGVDDGDGTVDGDIELSESLLSSYGAFSLPYDGDWKFVITSSSGYGNYDSGPLTYNPSINNSVASSLNSNLKVAVNNYPFADMVTTGSQVAITSSMYCNGLIAIDGGTNDMDLTQNGYIYIKCPMVGSTDIISFTVSATGYVDDNITDLSISKDVQSFYTSSNQFTLKTAIQNEPGNPVSGATVTASGGSISCAEDGATGVYYCAVPNGQSTNINATKTGYVTKAKGTAGGASEAGPQVTNNLTGADAMQHQIKVMSGLGNLEDSSGLPLTFDGTETVQVCTASDCAGGPEATIDNHFDAGSWYIAPTTTGAKYMKVTKFGYQPQIDGSPIMAAPAGPQVSPAFTQAGGDGLVSASDTTPPTFAGVESVVGCGSGCLRGRTRRGRSRTTFIKLRAAAARTSLPRIIPPPACQSRRPVSPTGSSITSSSARRTPRTMKIRIRWRRSERCPQRAARIGPDSAATITTLEKARPLFLSQSMSCGPPISVDC